MNKERLEEIKQDVKMTRKDLAVSPSNEMTLNMGILLNTMDCLIEQAERVQELEDIIYQDERQAVLEGMYEQNKRYREALEFIGNHANESEMMDDVMYTELVKEVIEKALEE